MKLLFFSLWKFAKFLMSFLKAQVCFSFPSNSTPLFFFSSNIIYLGQKQPIKVQSFEIFEVLGSKFVKFLMSILNWQVSSSLDFASFLIVMTYNSPVNFTLMHFLLWVKFSHQSPNFEAFECSGEIYQIPHVIFQTTS